MFDMPWAFVCSQRSNAHISRGGSMSFMSSFSRKRSENSSSIIARSNEWRANLWRSLLAGVALCGGLAVGEAKAVDPQTNVLWGVMDWKTDASAPDTDTSTARPIFTDGGCHLLTHQYQSPTWLASKTSQANKNEIARVYAEGHAINLMLYFVSCTYDGTNWGYALSDQFITDFSALVDAYKTGGGPLYIQAFPEFEVWYENKPAATQDAYRARIATQYAKMVNIVRTKYSKGYIGLCFFGRDFANDTSQFATRWGPTIRISDLVYVNTMTTFPNWDEHAFYYTKATKYLADNFAIPIMFPYIDLWDDQNSPIFSDDEDHTVSAAYFSDCISSWVENCLTAPAEVIGTNATNYKTNLSVLRSRGVFAFSLYSENYCNKPATPATLWYYSPCPAPMPLQSYDDLTTVMTNNGQSSLYPFHEVEFPQILNPTVASTSTTVVSDGYLSAGKGVVLNATSATGQYVTFRVPVMKSGTYRVYVGIRKQTDGGWFKLYVNGSGSPLGSERNCSLASGVGNYQQYDQGTVTLTAAQTTFVDFKFGVTQAGAAGGYKLPIDFVKLVPQ